MRAPKFRFTVFSQMVSTARGVVRVPKGALVYDDVEFDTPQEALTSLRDDLGTIHVRRGHGIRQQAEMCLKEPCVGVKSAIRAVESTIPAVVQ